MPVQPRRDISPQMHFLTVICAEITPAVLTKKWGVAHDSVGAIRCQVDVTAVEKNAPDVRKRCCGLSASHGC